MGHRRTDALFDTQGTVTSGTCLDVLLRVVGLDQFFIDWDEGRVFLSYSMGTMWSCSALLMFIWLHFIYASPVFDCSSVAVEGAV
jgi:hypothetical protein